MLQIKTIDGMLLFEYESASLRELLAVAVAANASLQGANLRGANLQDANLWDANLGGASLQGANLQGASLWGANLQGANLQGASLWGANLQGANLRGANLRGANLQGANLQGANLQGASLHDANLWGASLQGANLQGANLRGANLWGANLQGAYGIHRDLITPLRILLDQPAAIRAYKLVTAEGAGPFHGGTTYELGKSYEVPDANTDEFDVCAPGINLCTLDWALKEWRKGYRILIAEFTREDIAAIPVASDGKFRVRRCTIVGEKSLKEIGWPLPIR